MDQEIEIHDLDYNFCEDLEEEERDDSDTIHRVVVTVEGEAL